MLEWNENREQHHAHAKTDFASLRIEVDWPASRANGVLNDDRNIRYEARVESIVGVVLVSKGNIDSQDAARSWCEQSYIAVLQEELARVGG